MLKPLNVPPRIRVLLPAQGERLTELRLAQLTLSMVTGSFAFVVLLLLFTVMEQSVQAAPPARPLAEIITDTVKVTHTENTTHQMSVFGNGRITDQFRNDNGTDQINDSPGGTTIAIMFDQHISTANTVDVGVQNEFAPTTPITLNTSSDIPGYSEDSYVVYASGVLSYQITQRTLATDTNNCVIMELVIRNTGSVTSLTGGKLLYMVDIDVGRQPVDDKGFYDPARRLVYLTDYKPELGEKRAYAMGISLLEGDWRGHGVNGQSYPDSDADIRNEMITPTNAIVDWHNDVVWIVANITDLDPGQATTLAFGLCARTAEGKGEETQLLAAANLKDSFDQQANLSVSKTATPIAGSPVVAGELITYSIMITSTGYRYVDNIVITDTLPASTDLLTYSVSRGSITASNKLITTTIGRLYPTSGTLTVTLVVAPYITSTNGTVISNQAFIKGEPIITVTNAITHQIINAPILTVTKRADPEPVVGAGEVLTYAIVISSGGQGYATGVIVSDTLPANTEFITGSITLNPPGSGIIGTAPPILASHVTVTAGQSVTVTFAVTVAKPLTDGISITNTVVVTSTQVPTPTTSTITSTVTTTPVPAMALSKAADPDATRSHDSWTMYRFQITNTGNVPLTSIQVWDDQLSPEVGPFSVSDLSVGETEIITRWWPMTCDTYNVATATAQSPGFPDLVSATDDAYYDVVEGLSLALDVSVQPEVIPAARVVTYTYQLTNTSHDWMAEGIITDALYGNTASGLSLAPGESYVGVFTQLVATTTVNTAYARGTDRLGSVTTATDSAKVTVGMQDIYLPVIMKNH